MCKYEVFFFIHNSAEIIYLLPIVHSSNGKEDYTSSGSVNREKYEIGRYGILDFCKNV